MRLESGYPSAESRLNRQTATAPLGDGDPVAFGSATTDEVIGDVVPQSPEEGGSGATLQQKERARDVRELCKNEVRRALLTTLKGLAGTQENWAQQAGFRTIGEMITFFWQSIALPHAKGVLFQGKLRSAEVNFDELQQSVRRQLIARIPQLRGQF